MKLITILFLLYIVASTLLLIGCTGYETTNDTKSIVACEQYCISKNQTYDYTMAYYDTSQPKNISSLQPLLCTCLSHYYIPVQE